MIKFGVLLAIAAVCSFSSATAETCTRDVSTLFTKIDFVDMRSNCVKATEEQIQKEITASLKYLTMAAFFAKDSVNRPGFAHFFFHAATEEREHAYKLIEYLSMRASYQKAEGSKITGLDISKLVKDAEGQSDDFVALMGKVDLVSLIPPTTTDVNEQTTSGLIALQNALKMEVAVTSSIRKLVKECEQEPFNHYHFVDYLTGEFLDEQYKGQRDIAGKISTLGKMVKSQGAELADFLFDKTLL